MVNTTHAKKRRRWLRSLNHLRLYGLKGPVCGGGVRPPHPHCTRRRLLPALVQATGITENRLVILLTALKGLGLMTERDGRFTNAPATTGI